MRGEGSSPHRLSAVGRSPWLPLIQENQSSVLGTVLGELCPVPGRGAGGDLSLCQGARSGKQTTGTGVPEHQGAVASCSPESRAETGWEPLQAGDPQFPNTLFWKDKRTQTSRGPAPGQGGGSVRSTSSEPRTCFHGAGLLSAGPAQSPTLSGQGWGVTGTSPGPLGTL